MQPNVLSEPILEELYEKVILPQFGIAGDIKWEEHLTIGPDNEAHVFICNKKRMALVFDDYPTTDEGSLAVEFPFCNITRMTRDSAGGSVTVDDKTPQASDDEYILRFGPSGLPFKYIHDVTGYFQLFDIERLDGMRP